MQSVDTLILDVTFLIKYHVKCMTVEFTWIREYLRSCFNVPRRDLKKKKKKIVYKSFFYHWPFFFF